VLRPAPVAHGRAQTPSGPLKECEKCSGRGTHPKSLATYLLTAKLA
jgi:hypothetical protein